jgi:hypothetical protein
MTKENPMLRSFLFLAALAFAGLVYEAETELQDGSALLAGGYPNSDRATAQTWIYHP